jgi:hypothetical protein
MLRCTSSTNSRIVPAECAFLPFLDGRRPFTP